MCVRVFFHPIAKESEGVCGVQGKILNAHYSDPHTVRNGGKRKGETAAATAAHCKHTIDHNMKPLGSLFDVLLYMPWS